MEDHPTSSSLKFFIVICAPFEQINDGSLYSNALFIQNYALNILHLPEKSFRIFSPMDFDSFIKQTGAGYQRFRFLNDIYFKRFIPTNFISFESFNTVLSQIEKETNESTDAFILFLNHGEVENDLNIDLNEIYLFLAELKAHSKRIYLHSCFSGGLVEIAKICQQISLAFIKNIEPIIDSLRPLVDLLGKEKTIELDRLFETITTILQQEETITNILQSYSQTVSL